MNKKILFVFIVAAAFCSGLLWVPTQAQAKKATAIIGTGSKAGVYYPTGVTIATIVNREGDFRLNAESTKGSIDNIIACVSGKREFGIAQSDRLYKAVKGKNRWAKNGPRKDLRTVFAIYPEYITLTAAADAKINSLEDLKGKRVNFSQYKKGFDRTLVQIVETAGLKHADWVVLSACNTAAGNGAGAEAISGLGQSFFYAGGRSLLVTSWPVETTSAKALTTALFRRLADQPDLDRADALRQTIIEIMDSPEHNGFCYAHPIFWAPYILVGDSR